MLMHILLCTTWKYLCIEFYQESRKIMLSFRVIIRSHGCFSHSLSVRDLRGDQRQKAHDDRSLSIPILNKGINMSCSLRPKLPWPHCRPSGLHQLRWRGAGTRSKGRWMEWLKSVPFVFLPVHVVATLPRLRSPEGWHSGTDGQVEGRRREGEGEAQEIRLIIAKGESRAQWARTRGGEECKIKERVAKN